MSGLRKKLNSLGTCQPRGHCASVDDHTAGSECSVLIYYSHNSHSLSNYSVDVALEVVDHGHMSLGYEPNGSTVLTTVSSTRYMYYKSGAEFSLAPLALSWSSCTMYSDSLLLETYLVITE